MIILKIITNNKNVKSVGSDNETNNKKIVNWKHTVLQIIWNYY